MAGSTGCSFPLPFALPAAPPSGCNSFRASTPRNTLPKGAVAPTAMEPPRHASRAPHPLLQWRTGLLLSVARATSWWLCCLLRRSFAISKGFQDSRTSGATRHASCCLPTYTKSSRSSSVTKHLRSSFGPQKYGVASLRSPSCIPFSTCGSWMNPFWHR